MTQNTHDDPATDAALPDESPAIDDTIAESPFIENALIARESAGTRMFLASILVIGLLLVGIALALNFRQSLLAPAPTATFEPDLPGVLTIDPPREVVDFTLPSNEVTPLALSDLPDGYTLIFFGFTHCPDFCPLTLSKFVQIKRNLADLGDTVNYLFISVDAPRDTPAVLDTYLANFDPAFIGLQADEATLTHIAADYGLYWELMEPDENGDYQVDHSTSSYLLDPQNRLRAIFTFQATTDAMTTTLVNMMAE